MKSWCCIDQGQSTISATVGKNVHSIGDTVEAIAEIDNSQCKMDIEKVTISLENKLHLKAGKRKRDVWHTVFREDFPGLGKFETALGDKMMRL